MVYALYIDWFIIINSIIFYLTAISARLKTKREKTIEGYNYLLFRYSTNFW